MVVLIQALPISSISESTIDIMKRRWNEAMLGKHERNSYFFMLSPSHPACFSLRKFHHLVFGFKAFFYGDIELTWAVSY